MNSTKFAGDRVALRLRASIVALDIIALGFLLDAVRKYQHYFDYSANSTSALIYCLPLAIAPILLSLIWTVVSLIISYTKGAYRPGIDVGMELLAWLLVVGTVWNLFYWIYAIGYYSNIPCGSSESCTRNRSALRVLFAYEIVVATLTLVFGLLHFTLFVRACQKQHLRRIMKRNARSGADEPRELAENIMVIPQSKHDIV